MPDIVIADTTCFIILSAINELALLRKVYQNIITTPDIQQEFGEDLPEWVAIRAPKDHEKQQLLELQVDKGEASAIALAMEIRGCTIILDDLKARLAAVNLDLVVTGTLGVIVKAKLNGIIPSVKPFLDKIRQTNFRVSPQLIELVLKQAGE